MVRQLCILFPRSGEGRPLDESDTVWLSRMEWNSESGSLDQLQEPGIFFLSRHIWKGKIACLKKFQLIDVW